MSAKYYLVLHVLSKSCPIVEKLKLGDNWMNVVVGFVSDGETAHVTNVFSPQTWREEQNDALLYERAKSEMAQKFPNAERLSRSFDVADGIPDLDFDF